MKKVYLHGALGKRFGKKWELNVSTPAEAISALFANEPEIEKYLNKKHQEGIYYGIKKSGEDNFSETKDYPLRTKKDLHVFALPQGAGFLGSLVWVAITTAASIYVSKKMAEAMERDDSTLQAQTKSYLYNGSDNRFNQGSTIPVGYGKIKVGSNVVSACNINYDYNSEVGKIFSFSNGLHSLVPSYSPHYYVDLGPLVSSFARSVFDGESKYRIVDPAFQYLVNLANNTEFGTIDGLYGGFEPVEDQKNRATTVDKKGNSIGGYYFYTYNYAKGVDQEFLGHFNAENGNWYPEGWNSADIPEQESKRFAVPESSALKSSFVCLQSVPVTGNDASEKIFYPIIWSQDSLPDLRGSDENTVTEGGNTSFPVQVGQRWRNEKKSDGVGWHKLESTSIYKSVDLISEGEIDGFADKNGHHMPFDSGHKTDDENPIDRQPKDDYLQGVFLDDTPVKEINFQTDDGGIDAYNINEFDIDVGMNSEGEIGSEDQRLLENQYLFTAYTKEINSPLYGPRTVNFAEQKYILPSTEFVQGATYDEGDYVTYQDTVYRVMQSTNEEFNPKGDYHEGSFVYEGQPGSAIFYEAKPEIDGYETFSGEGAPYAQGDEIRTQHRDHNHPDEEGNPAESIGYYTMGSDANKFLGTYDSTASYSNKKGSILMNDQVHVDDPNTNSVLHLITGDSMAAGDDIGSFTEIISHQETVDNISLSYDRDPVWLLKNLATVFGGSIAEFDNWSDPTLDPLPQITVPLSSDIIGDAADISPATSNLWDQSQLTNPEDMPGVFSKIEGSDLDNVIARMIQEENYISHTIINPLVEEAYISLQLDELGYTYEGDEVNVEYQIGKLWTWLLGALVVYHTVQSIFDFQDAGAKAALTATHTSTVHGVIAMPLQGVPPAPAHPAVTMNAGMIVAGFLEDTKDSGAKSLAGIALNFLLGIGLTLLAATHRFNIGTKIENSGEIWPNKARFRIKYGNEGEVSYSTDVYFYGIATSPYRKDIKIFLPPNPDQRDRVIKVYKLNRERNPVKEGEQAARYKEKMTFAGVTEITPVKMNYPDSVVIGTRVNAKDVGSIPKRTYHMRMKKVLIPSNYNPETREYTGNWDGVFQLDPKWTDNPAWCMYDLISNKRFGVGRFGIKDENIDRWTLYKMAKYCDHLIPTGYSPKYKKRRFSKISEVSYGEFALEFRHPGKKLAIFHDDGTYESIKIAETKRDTKEVVLEHQPSSSDFDCAVEIDYPLLEPRYTMNAYIMDKQNAFKLISEFAAIFRAFAYWSGGAINFFQDEKKDPVMLFSNNNISEEGFSYSSTPKTSRTNSCNIRYTDRYNMYRAKVERAEDREAVQENNMIEQTIDGFGITSQAQAKRAAEFVVKGANLETEIVSFKTSMLGSYLKPGDVVEVLDNKRTVGRFAGKIIDVDVDDRGIKAEVTLDYPIYTYIDKEDKKTWKNITIYQPSGNETITSLDSMTEVEDTDIDNMRAKQVGEYLVYDISEDSRKLKLYSSPYSYVSGQYTWLEALKDSKTKEGRMATIVDSDEQLFMKTELPEDGTGWLGGYKEQPPADGWVWHSTTSCGSNDIDYTDWAEGFPEPTEAFLFVTGSSDKEVHGDWMNTSGSVEMGYLLEQIQIDSFELILDSEGTTFALEDKVNLANKKQFKVMNITEDSNGLFSISALEYNVDKFDNIEKDLSIKQPEYPVIFNEDSIYKNT
jgi:predicted phage tail protein